MGSQQARLNALADNAANKGPPPQAAGYFRREPVGVSRVASGTPGLTSWRGRGSLPGPTPQVAGDGAKGIQEAIATWPVSVDRRNPSSASAGVLQPSVFAGPGVEGD